MRLLIARCSVDYSGRLTAHLPEATRLIMVKADGTLAIHSDGNASKPLNWMVAPNVLEIHDDKWVATNGKGETLTIWIRELLEDVTHRLGDDPGLEKDGVEAHLQGLLAAKPWVLEEGLTLIRREYPVRGIFAAQVIAPQARVIAEARGIEAIEVDYDGLREAEDAELRLFDIR